MIATKQMDVRADIKKYFDMAFSGEPVIVSRKENKNVVIISESEYNELEKAKKNVEYLAKLNRADEQVKNGQVVTKTMDLCWFERYPHLSLPDLWLVKVFCL